MGVDVKMAKDKTYEIWESDILDGDTKLSYSFNDKQLAIDHIDKYNRDKDYYDGDTILYYKEVKLNTRG